VARAGQPADHGRRRRVDLSGLFTFAVSRKYATDNPVALVKLDEHKKTSKASVTPVTKAQIGDMATKAFTDSGTIRDDRALMHRRTSDRRIVPIPPSLVTVLRERINGRRAGLRWISDVRETGDAALRRLVPDG